MKLLEDMPSVEVRTRSDRRSRVTLAVTVGVLLLGAAAGTILLTTSSDLGGSGQAGDQTGADAPPVELATWVDGATQVCATVATDHPVLTQGAAARVDAANVVAVDNGVRALTTGVRELAAPTAAADQAGTTEVIGLGDQADQAWYALSGAPAEATAEQLSAASDLSAAFVAGLVGLGADCAALG